MLFCYFLHLTNAPQIAERGTAEDGEASITLPIISIDQLIHVCQSPKVIQFKVFSNIPFLMVVELW